jgi:hypothetical protein
VVTVRGAVAVTVVPVRGAVAVAVLVAVTVAVVPVRGAVAVTVPVRNDVAVPLPVRSDVAVPLLVRSEVAVPVRSDVAVPEFDPEEPYSYTSSSNVVMYLVCSTSFPSASVVVVFSVSTLTMLGLEAAAPASASRYMIPYQCMIGAVREQSDSVFEVVDAVS